jgi:energy-coupling factor transporter ATP-binding protein EcfA2
MTGAAHTQQVLVLGAHESGKTTFVVQLLGRVQRVQEGRLRAREAPSSLVPYKAALERIEEGRAPEHTERSLFAETPLPLVHDTAGPVDLVWPEYAGETIRQMVTTRRIPQRWYDRVQQSDVWLLFVRPSATFVPPDVISRRIFPVQEESVPEGEERQGNEEEEGVTELSGQASLVELLQMLLHLRGVSTARPVAQPVLGVLLSCFDEVMEPGHSPASEKQAPTTPPEEVFRERLPLLASFVDSVWDPNSRVVLGVAALGRPLLPNEPDVDFIVEGPERQGYVVLPDGQQNSDLTLAVSLALDLLHE